MEGFAIDDTGTTSIEYALIALILGELRRLAVREGVTTDRRSSRRS